MVSSSTPATVAGTQAEQQAARLARLHRISRLMDSAIRLPGGMRIGWDGIIGLIPGIGDLVGAGVSSYIIWQGVKLGVPRAVIVRMILNVVLETGVGSIPIAGDAFDVVFKANIRNVRMIKEALKSAGTLGPTV